MDRTDFVTALRRDGDAFSLRCAVAGLDAPVPTCPGWSVADLVWHLAEVHCFWRTVVAGALEVPDSYEPPARPADSDLLAFYRAGLDDTVTVLAAADPYAVNWTWTADHTAGFVQRRMAQETAVHLADAATASGAAPSVDPALASDGIDEFLEHFLGVTNGTPGGSVHIHCTDVAGEWTIRESADAASGFDVQREHAKGDCAIRGAASDILLALWRRAPLSACDVVGDAAVAERFVAASRLE